MNNKIVKLVIVGGGTAGWLSAAYLSSQIGGNSEGEKLDITLIEASEIPPIGVGEATVPSIRNTIRALGVSEFEFMRECDATFKHGIKFVDWQNSPQTSPGNFYYHPFQRPVSAGHESLAGYWLKGNDPYSRKFHDAATVQPRIAELDLAPKNFNDPDFEGPLPYAYHLDAGKLAVFLRNKAKDKGVSHVIGKVERVNNKGDGSIASLTLKSGEVISGDVFIDCSGFSSLLIGKNLQEPFIDYSHILFNDRAITCQVPHIDPNQPILPYTLSTAQSAGWIWDIGLNNRRGTGHVFSSSYMSADEAESVLRGYIGPQSKNLSTRMLKFKIGYRDRQWVKNCISVGLSGGFLEPLESTGIHLIELSLNMIETFLPRYLSGGKPQDRFNELMRSHYNISIEFVKLHYHISSRTDSTYWRDNTSESSSTPDLIKKMKDWQTGYPNAYDVYVFHSVFDHFSYQYVNFGMEKYPTKDVVYGHDNLELALRMFKATYEALDKAKHVLPNHRSIIEKIRSYKDIVNQ